jgi:hypothetical protein
MKHYLPAIITILVVISVIAYGRQPVPNPDTNHTHADFAVWMPMTRNSDESQNIEKLDFTSPAFMSGLSTDDHTHDEPEEYHHQYLHLHDGNGHVMHSHKPDQTIGEFFLSIGAAMSSTMELDGKIIQNNCFSWTDAKSEKYSRCSGEWGYTIHMFVNGVEVSYNPEYVFKDGDTILIISATSNDQIQTALSDMTEDACLYSKTCPWRGTPPTENCIADPLIPCIAP